MKINQLMVLPVCRVHKEQMVYRKTEGESESWGGVWYDCPKCFSSVVIKADVDSSKKTLICQMPQSG